MKDSNYFIERHAGGEKAVLVHIDFPQQPNHGDELCEFQDLVRSAGLEILETITSRRDRPSTKFFVGKGKAEEINDVVRATKAEVVLFNHELSPAQGRNLEKLFCVRVIDRTELILDIFAQRAHTFEGKLQVELAQLKHLRTRLVRGWTHLERQKGGIGLRGPGETQLETDRRMIGVRIKNIQRRLDKILNQREQGRRARKRNDVPTVSMVGYTNAGKSTLFNCLTGADVYAAHQLFATLDPTLRQIQLTQLGTIIVADTVGFIRKLPHDLVAAFRATLEETRQADLLLHVVDVAREDYLRFVEDVNIVLTEIKADKVPQLLVCNKIDLKNHLVPRIDRDEQGQPWRVWVSAEADLGMDLLRQAIVELVSQTVVQCEIVLEANEGKLRAKLYELRAVKAESMNENGHIVLQIEIQHSDYQRLLKSRCVAS